MKLPKTNSSNIDFYDPSLFELKAEEFINDFEEKWATDKQVKKDNKFTFFNLFKKRKIKVIQKQH